MVEGKVAEGELSAVLAELSAVLTAEPAREGGAGETVAPRYFTHPETQS